MNRESAQTQGRRLQDAIPSAFPAQSQMKTEVVDCLLRNCLDDTHLERTVTRVLETFEGRNLLAALTRAARETAAAIVSPATVWDTAAGRYVPIASTRGLELIGATTEQRSLLNGR